MKRALIILLAIIALPCFAQGADNSAPSHEQIKKWLRAEYPKKPDKKIVIKKMAPIQLKSGEKAFLATVKFPERGRCCEDAALLVRAAKRKAREIEEVFTDFETYDLDNDKTTEISASRLHGMGGRINGKKTILIFDDWEPVVLHAQYIGDSDRSCGRASHVPCYHKNVIWTFHKLDADASKDLVELTVYRYQNEQYQWKWVIEKNAYLLKDKKFIPTSPDPTQSEWVQRDELERFFCSYPVDPRDYTTEKGNTPSKVIKGEVLLSSPSRCLGLRVIDGNSSKIVGIRLRNKGVRNIDPNHFLDAGDKVEVECTYENGFLYGRSVQKIKKASLETENEKTKKDCSKYIQLLAKASDERDMRAKAREYVLRLIQAGLPLEKATTRVIATIDTLYALQKTSINPEKLRLFGPVLSGKMDQRDKVGEAGYPSEANKMKEVSKQEEVQTFPSGQVDAEKKPHIIPIVEADISKINITQKNIRKGVIFKLKNVSDIDLIIGVNFPKESLMYTSIVRDLEQTKVPGSEWEHFVLQAHNVVLLVIIADPDSTTHPIKQLNGKKIDVSVWKGEEQIQNISIPFRVSKDLLGSAK